MARKGGLGKGLDALIPGDSSGSGDGAASFVSTSQIIANPRQPRQHMHPDELSGLAESIKEHGILQPLLVSQEPGSDHYVLIAGERRLRAAELAGLQNVPVLIRQATDQERLELALIENVQRSDLTPLETAEAYRQLSEEFDLTHEDIALRVGKSRESVSNTLRLLKLSGAVRQALATGQISEGHARALLALEYAAAQDAALQTILKAEMTVRQTEELVRKLKGERPSRLATHLPTPEIKELEERLRTHLGTKVVLRHGKKGGSMVIHYYSDEELNTLIERFLKE
jgi:ParB family transcriptional regulator, chromosome partitioning protein